MSFGGNLPSRSVKRVLLLLVLIGALYWVANLPHLRQHQGVASEILSESLQEILSVEKNGNNNTGKALLVSCFYPPQDLEESRLLELVSRHVKGFFEQTSADVLVFTSENYREILEGASTSNQSAARKIYWNVTYDSPQHLPSFVHLRAKKLDVVGKWDAKSVETSRIQGVWHGRLWMMVQAELLQSAEDYTHVFWQDMAAFESSTNSKAALPSEWPDYRVISSQLEPESSTPKFFQSSIASISDKNFESWDSETKGPAPGNFLEGGFFGGNRASVRWYANKFYNLFDKHPLDDISNPARSYFGAIAIQHPQYVWTFDLSQWNEDVCGDPYFAYKTIFATSENLEKNVAEKCRCLRISPFSTILAKQIALLRKNEEMERADAYRDAEPELM